MTLSGSDDCSGFIRAEAAALAAIAEGVTLAGYDDAAGRLAGIHVDVVFPGETDPARRFNFWGTWSRGMYQHAFRSMTLNNDAWSTNTLTHEILHSLQGDNPKHVGWIENGFLRAEFLAHVALESGI